MTASPFKALTEWTAAEAARVVGAPTPATAPERRFGAISTDTRAIQPGDWFLALRGENFDGHRFCAAAVEKGAQGLIVAEDFPNDMDGALPILRVVDPLKAYGDLAHHQRETWGGPALAISGSVGKTTTRRLLAGALERRLKVLEPIRNFNNLIGVPQTLLRLEADHRAAVLELGMNLPGELKRLAEIARPTASGLTRIGMTHVGMFPTLDDLIEAKLQLFEGTPAGAPLVVNAGCANSRRALERFSGSHPIITFRGEGDAKADFFPERVQALADQVGYRFDLVTPEGRIAGLTLRHFGRHFVENIACAAGMLRAGGFPSEWIADSVENFRTEPLRGQVVKAGDWTFILDCYNAAPDSMAAALDSLAELRRGNGVGRLVLVLADMLELGDHSRAAHEALLPRVRALSPDLFCGLGEQSLRLAETLGKEGRDARPFADAAPLTGFLAETLRPGDTVFFKGSHGFALEKVAAKLVPSLDLDH